MCSSMPLRMRAQRKFDTGSVDQTLAESIHVRDVRFEIEMAHGRSSWEVALQVALTAAPIGGRQGARTGVLHRCANCAAPVFSRVFQGRPTGDGDRSTLSQRLQRDSCRSGCKQSHSPKCYVAVETEGAQCSRRKTNKLTQGKLDLITKSLISAWAGKDGGAPGDSFLTEPRQCHFNQTPCRNVRAQTVQQQLAHHGPTGRIEGNL